MTYRTGIGVDIHAYAADGTLGLVLAGVEFPDQRSLAGHSDGDVAAHAAADALLSAASLGDLGENFDRRDPRWQNAGGIVLLQETAALVRAAGYEVVNISLQIIGSRPKIATMRAQAQENLSAAAGAPVSLAGTTSDGLGFTGRDEGLAAIATALVRAI